MIHVLKIVLLLLPCCSADDVEKSLMSWPMESLNAFRVHGSAALGQGVRGSSVVLSNQSMLTVKNSRDAGTSSEGFTLTVWVNPYVTNDGQQIIAGKNRYALNEREWGLMLDRDGHVRLYLWQNKWLTIDADFQPEPGHWFQAGVVIQPRNAELWINGERAAQATLKHPIAKTDAPLTFGGIDDDGNIRQTLWGALDEVCLYNGAADKRQLTADYRPVSATHEIPERPGNMGVTIDLARQKQADTDAEHDRTSVIFDGQSPDRLACDTTLRLMPDGSWVMVMLGGGDKEPHPRNQVFITRSHDKGQTWDPMRPVDFGFPREGSTKAMVPSELMVYDGRCTIFFATHNGAFDGWKEWMAVSTDSCRTWNEPVGAPGRLHDRTFIRNHIVTRDGRILLPFQHYLNSPGPRNPRNGVLISSDGGATWSEHGDIRISSGDKYRGWAENNIVELANGHIAMIIRADGRGVLYYAESEDGGRTWPKFAHRTTIPNPGSKATLYPLGSDSVALLHNPSSRHRSPLALWVSFDGMKSWPYQRVLVSESSDGPKGRLNYPDGFISRDKRWLHFAFDDNRHRAVYVGARLPQSADQ